MWLRVYVPIAQQTSNRAKPQSLGSVRPLPLRLPEQNVSITDISMEDPSLHEKTTSHYSGMSAAIYKVANITYLPVHPKRPPTRHRVF